MTKAKKSSKSCTLTYGTLKQGNVGSAIEQLLDKTSDISTQIGLNLVLEKIIALNKVFANVQNKLIDKHDKAKGKEKQEIYDKLVKLNEKRLDLGNKIKVPNFERLGLGGLAVRQLSHIVEVPGYESLEKERSKIETPSEEEILADLD